MRFLSFLFSAMLLAASGSALAQVQRLLPKDARQGVLAGQKHAFPLIEINNKVVRLAPGGVIVDERNRTIVHAALPAQAPILFNEDSSGEITRIIVLRPEERRMLEQMSPR